MHEQTSTIFFLKKVKCFNKCMSMLQLEHALLEYAQVEHAHALIAPVSSDQLFSTSLCANQLLYINCVDM